MKITYIHQYFNTPKDSGSTRSYEFARRLVDAGHQVNLVTTAREKNINGSGGRGWETTVEDGICVHWYPVAYSNRMSFVLRVKAFMEFAIVSTVRALQLPTDVVFATSTPLTVGIPAVVVSLVRRVPMVFEVRDLWPDVPIAMGLLRNSLARVLAQGLEKVSYRQASHIIALSPDMKKGIVEKGLSPDRITVIPNASDLAVFDVPEKEGEDFRARHDWIKNRPLIVYAGTFGQVNGVEYLVKLAGEVNHLRPDVRFLLIGDGAELERVREAASSMGILEKNFFIRPPVEKEKLSTIISAATICCSTVIDNEALWANSANKVFDSLAAGRPIFINHKGWQKDFLEKSGAGVVLSATNFLHAANTLVQLLDDGPRLQQMRVAAKNLATTKFSRNILAKQFQTVLEQAYK